MTTARRPGPPALLDAIRQRHACREFLAGRPVSADALALLLEAGRLAPSSFGLGPWRFATVDSAAERAAVVQACYDQPAAAAAQAAGRPAGGFRAYLSIRPEKIDMSTARGVSRATSREP